MRSPLVAKPVANWATIAVLLQIARMNDVDPHAWLTQILKWIVRGWPISHIALMPWHFKV